MSMVIKNNLSALHALNQLNENHSELSKRLAKVSSGMKINSAQDDASGYSISERMRVQIRSLDQDRQNVQNGSAMLRTAAGGVDDIINILRTMKEKAINAANDSNTDEDRLIIQKEFIQLTDAINDVALGNEYNGKRLLSGRYDPRTKENALQVAKAMMSSLNETSLSGTKALDEAIKAASNGKFASTDALIQSFMGALESYDQTDYAKFLKDACDIDLTNTDTGAITGSDAGASTVPKTAESIVPERIAVTSWGLPSDSTTTIEGLTLNWPTEGVDSSGNPSGTLSDAEKQILKGLNSDWTEQCLKLIKRSYGIDFNDPNATVKDINVKFENDSSSNALAYVYMQSGNLDLVVNMKFYNNIDMTSEDGASSSTSAYLDRTLAHEFTHAVMAANINNFGSLPMYFVEGTAELVHGIDDERRTRIEELVSTRRNDLESVFQSATGGNSGDADPYAAGYMLLRYLAKQGQGPRDVPLVIHHGTQAGQHTNFYIKDMQTKSLTAGEIFSGIDELMNENDKARYDALSYDSKKQAEWLETLYAADGMTVDDISVKTVKDANIAIRVLDGALEYSLDNATTIGASLQRLDFTETNITTMNENVQASESTIRDADMAKEMMAFTKANVLSQAA